MTEDGAGPEGQRADPASVAHFRILGRLGAGGMGVVYRAEDETLRRTVALKLLSDTGGDEETRQRFLREARSAAAITHPNVATVYQVGEADGRPYIAMELVEGESLRTRLGRGRLDVAAARELATQMARGLAAAHGKGIVHRDLKPENVMITPEGVVKLLDFGLAKPATERVISGTTDVGLAKTETLVTSDAGRVMGTAEYMSPEQAVGEPLDVRSDVFSFGVVLYEMLAGSRPFGALTTGALLVAIARDPAPPLHERAPEVDAATAALVTRCLAKSPDDRFARGAEIVAALSGHSRNAATEPPAALAHGDGPDRGRRPARTVGVVAALLLLVAAASAIGIAVVRRPPASLAAASASAAPRATAITDIPPLPTKVPEAASEYAQGMQAVHDASVEQGRKHLLRAVQLDPRFALAQLMAAVWYMGAVDEQRKLLAAASELRSQLGERDAAILEVEQAALGRDKPDFEDVARRWKALADRFPLDAYAADSLAGISCLQSGRREEGFALLDRALVLDRKFAEPLGERAWFQREYGDPDGALASTDRCLALSPSPATCLQVRTDVEQRRGQCARLEEDARRWIAFDPESEDAYDYLANALVSNGAPIESIDEALRRAREHATTAASKAQREVSDPVTEGMLTGDFASAIGAFPALEAYSARQTSDSTVGDCVAKEIFVYSAVGRDDRAADVAEAYLKRRPALTLDDPEDARNVALYQLHVTGRISEAEFRANQELWARESAALQPPRLASLTWLGYYAAISWTPADARRALEALPGYPPLPPFDGQVYDERATGQVLLLAGRVDEAIPHLRRAVGACFGLEYIASHQLAAEMLGEALEQKRDTAGSCDAYAEVLKRWGRAKPRSVIAEKARARSRVLGCAPR